MSKQNVKRKVLDASSKSGEKSGWIRLAEGAEQDAAKAHTRSEQLYPSSRVPSYLRFLQGAGAVDPPELTFLDRQLRCKEQPNC